MFRIPPSSLPAYFAAERIRELTWQFGSINLNLNYSEGTAFNLCILIFARINNSPKVWLLNRNVRYVTVQKMVIKTIDVAFFA